MQRPPVLDVGAVYGHRPRSAELLGDGRGSQPVGQPFGVDPHAADDVAGVEDVAHPVE